jgi:hypothetical protein
MRSKILYIYIYIYMMYQKYVDQLQQSYSHQSEEKSPHERTISEFNWKITFNNTYLNHVLIHLHMA